MKSALIQDRFFIATTFFLWLVLASCHLYFLQANPTFHTPIIDSHEYVREAREVKSDEPYYHSPFYVWYIQICFNVAGFNLWIPRIFQLLVQFVAGLILYLIGSVCFSKNIARISLLLWVMYGPFLFYSCELINVSWILLFYLATVLGVILGERSNSIGYWLIAGASLALSVLTRPDVLLFGVCVAVILLWKCAAKRARWISLAAWIAPTAVALFLVGLRNDKVSGHFISLPINSGLNFYFGNNADFQRTIGIRPGNRWDKLTKEPFEAGAVTHRGDPAQSRYFYQKSFQQLQEQPSLLFQAGLYKLRTLFNGYELPETFDIYTYGKYSPVLRLLVFGAGEFYFPFAVLLPMALCGLFLVRKEWRQFIWLGLFVACMVISQLLYWNSSRYRLPLMPGIILFSGVLLYFLYEQALNWKWLEMFKVMLPALALGCLLNIPYPHFSKYYSFESEMYALSGMHMIHEQKLEPGIRHLIRSLEINPDNADAHNNLGTTLARQKNFPEAYHHFSRAIEIEPNHEAARQNYLRARKILGISEHEP